MKTKKYLLTIILTVLFSGCSEEVEEKLDYFYVRKYTTGDVVVYSDGTGTTDNFDHVEGAEAYLYLDESDYWLGKNPYAFGITDEFGVIQFKLEPDIKVNGYHFFASKGNLNSLRFSSPVNNTVYLSTTPTRLQIQIYKSGNPVSNANVQLYFSEDAYLSNLAANDDIEELKYSYLDITHLSKEDRSSWDYRFEKYFYQVSDSDGVVIFDNLEPRTYWFRITTEDGLSNDEGTITSGKPLPDDPNITTSITVGIN